MALRGLLATLAHQARVAAREHERAQRVAVQQHRAAIRRAEQAQRAAERLQAQLGRAAQAEHKRLEKEARATHIAAMEAAVEERNLRLAEIYEDIDSLLASTLIVDDYFDLQSLRVRVKHPPFDSVDLEQAIPPPSAIPDPPQPIYSPPEPPSGIARLLGGGRHAKAVAQAQAAHEAAVEKWRRALEQLPASREAAQKEYERAEAERLASLEAARERYSKECAAREAKGAESNRQLDKLIADLGYGTVEAVQEYIAIVLSNSVYPEHFPVSHQFGFEPPSAELRLRVLVPGPDRIPEIKAYKYTKSTDELTTVPLPQKACRDRYANAVHQVALRSIHEVFECDRRGLIKTISLEVGTETIDPATGRQAYIPFVAVGALRDAFLEFDLSAVVPSLTLERMGAAISKNPYGLAPAQICGVRRS